MSEQTPTLDQPAEDQSFERHWDEIDIMQKASAVSRERFLNDQAVAAEQDAINAAKEKKKTIARRATAGILATGVVAGGAYAAHELGQGPEFSEQTQEYVVESGDGLYDAAEQIEGINSIDIRDAVEHIQVDPANIDVLKDGLQPGETLIIPTSVED